jgi:hypothetical protein
LVFKAVEIDSPAFDAALAAKFRAELSSARQVPCCFFSFGLVAPRLAGAWDWEAHGESITVLRRVSPAQQLCLATEVTPHPARAPMKCVGNAGHPLPRGEGWFLLPKERAVVPTSRLEA